MFEKVAEEYRSHNTNYYEWDDFCADDGEAIEEAYQQGAEFGYKKANEWHYMKNEKPKDNEYVLIYTDLNNCYVATKVKDYFMSKGWGFIPMSTVIAWKEIILPKEGE